MGEWPKWGIGGIGRRYDTAAPVVRWCCTAEAVSEGACDGPGDNHFIVNHDEFDNIQHSSVHIPGDKSDILSRVRGQYVVPTNGFYAMLIVNCNDNGRATHLSGTLEWMKKAGDNSELGADNDSADSDDGSGDSDSADSDEGSSLDTNSTSTDDEVVNTTVVVNATISADDLSNATTTNGTAPVEESNATVTENTITPDTDSANSTTIVSNVTSDESNDITTTSNVTAASNETSAVTTSSTHATDTETTLNFPITNGVETTQSKSILNGNKGIANKAIPTGDEDSLNTTDIATPASSNTSSTGADNSTVSSGTEDDINAPSQTIQPVVDGSTVAPSNSTTGTSDVVPNSTSIESEGDVVGTQTPIETVLPTPVATTKPPVNPATGETGGTIETSRPTAPPTVNFDNEEDDDDDGNVQEDDQFERDDDGGPLPTDDDFDGSSSSGGGSGGGFDTPGINTEEEDVEQVESAFLSQFGLQDMPLWKSAGGIAAVAFVLVFGIYCCCCRRDRRSSRRKTVRADSWDWNDSDDDAEYGIPARYNDKHEYGEIPNSLMT